MSAISSYYNYAKLLSYNATINCVIGERGNGKTYGAKKKATKDAIKSAKFEERKIQTERRGKLVDGIQLVGETQDQFIYLRRYKEELQVARETFFADYEHEFPEYDFRTNGWEAQMSPIKYREVTKGRPWVTIGYFIALSVAQKFKSVAFPKVKTIIFDEFILERGATHYLPNEAIAFQNFYSTVDRYKDKTRVFMLANSVSITNPYFIEYKIKPDDADEKGFLKMRKGYLLVHFISDEAFRGEVYQTKFGQFIKETDYAEYAVENKFSDAHHGLVGSKTYKAKYQFTLETESGIFSIWFNMITGEYFCQEKRPKEETIYTIVPTKMSENKTLMTFADRPLAMLRTAYRHARMSFDEPSTRNAFIEIFKR